MKEKNRNAREKTGKGRARTGFTLIEVVSSLVIVGVSLVAVLQMFSFATRSAELTQKKLVTYTLLERKRDEIKCKTFSDDVTEEEESYTDSPGYVFTVTEDVPYNGNSYLKQVVIDVAYETSFSPDKTESLTLFVSDHR